MSVLKSEIIEQFRVSESDSGSARVQVALFTGRINSITEHLKVHKKDFSTRRGLLKLVGRRRALLSYLKKRDFEGYEGVIERLGLKK